MQIRKLRLYNHDKSKHIDLQDRDSHATNWQGLGLEYDLAFKESNDTEYLNNIKTSNKDIKANITFTSYVAFDNFNSFILANGRNPFILEYSTPHIETTKEIILKDEDINVEASDDEYFIHIPIISKYNLKQETIPFTETATYPEITRDKYAEVKLLEGKTEVINEQLVHVLNPLVQIQKDEEVTQAQFYTELKQWDTIKVINGDYKKEVGSGEIVFDGSEDWYYYSGAQSTKTDVATFYRSVTNMGLYSNYSNLVSNYFPFDYNVWNYNRVGISSHTTFSNIYINILKSELENYSDELSNEEKAILFKQWLQTQSTEGNPLTVAYELAEKTIEDVDMDGGLELIADGNIFVSDDNNLLNEVTLQYKPWNWSNVIKKINLKKFTISGDDLIIYLKANEVDDLQGNTIEDKVKKYFEINDSRATILLNEYIKSENIRYRDVYVKSLTKGERDNFNLLRSELTLRPNNAWYKETIYTPNLNEWFIINGIVNSVLNIEIETTSLSDLSITAEDNPAEGIVRFYQEISLEGYTIETEQYIVEDPEYFGKHSDKFIYDSLNKKIIQEHWQTNDADLAEMVIINLYKYIDLTKDSFIVFPEEKTYRMFIGGTGEANIKVIVKEWL